MSEAAEALRRAYDAAVAARGLTRDPAQIAALAALGRLLDDLTHAASLQGRLGRWLRWRPMTGSREPERGLYLWGPVGRGKTFLMDLFHAAVPVHSRRIHFHHFMREVQQRLHRLRRRPDPLALLADQLAAEARVICFDELQVTDIADAMILHGLLDALLRRGVTFVFTSNQPPAGLYPGGLQRERFLPAIHLLQRELEVIEVAGPTDFRLRNLQHGAVWFDASDPSSQQHMRQLFERLAGVTDARGEASRLVVEGRRIATLRQRPGLAWFSFPQLCEGPRGQADYIEIARLMHTVFLSDIPVMDERHDDAARRFIGLVDELYDRGVKLIASAAAEPAALYTGTRLAGAFARTASRLMEMRGTAYLAQAHRSTAAATPPTPVAVPLTP